MTTTILDCKRIINSYVTQYDQHILLLLIWILLEKLKELMLKILRGHQENCAYVYIDEISRKEKRKCQNKKKKVNVL